MKITALLGNALALSVPVAMAMMRSPFTMSCARSLKTGSNYILADGKPLPPPTAGKLIPRQVLQQAA